VDSHTSAESSSRIPETRLEEIPQGWKSQVGANGGYLAATALQALAGAFGDGWRARSLSVHFASPVTPGPVLISTNVEHTGRRTGIAQARVSQGERLALTATATFTPGLSGPEFTEAAMPNVPEADLCQVLPEIPDLLPEFFTQFEHRPCLGALPFSGATDSQTASWVRPRDLFCKNEEALLTVLSDCWMPAMFTRLPEPKTMATLSMNIHFRNAPGGLREPGREHLLVVAHSRLAHSGLCDQHIDIWSAPGTLLAQAHQLCMLLEPRGGTQDHHRSDDREMSTI